MNSILDSVAWAWGVCDIKKCSVAATFQVSVGGIKRLKPSTTVQFSGEALLAAPSSDDSGKER